jgi:hypothetical protein
MLQYGQYPEGLDPEQKAVFMHKVGPYTIQNGIFFQLTPDQKLKRCLEPKQVPKVNSALHLEDTGGHFVVNTTLKKIKNAGYWWPTMHRDTYQFIKHCDPCQRTQAPTITSHWPFTLILPLAPFEK